MRARPFERPVQTLAPAPEILVAILLRNVLILAHAAAVSPVALAGPPVVHFFPEMPYQLLDRMMVVVLVLEKTLRGRGVLDARRRTAQRRTVGTVPSSVAVDPVLRVLRLELMLVEAVGIVGVVGRHVLGGGTVFFEVLMRGVVIAARRLGIAE